ncbi:MAG: ORF6N domain-containing protein [Bacteroidetes bacterium]|nr:ORF6N domain-containing protein [Bacteroidota bacterium]
MKNKEKSNNEIMLSEEIIASKIYLIHGKRVMLDSDLAGIYGVTTTRLNQQVGRNLKRFPLDFMFELSKKEFENLMLQNATSRWGGRRKLPKVFTEHGAIMLASVLNSERAVNASINVVKAFISMREFISLSKELVQKLEKFELKTEQKLSEHDKKFLVVFETLKKVLIEESKPKRRIGFLP